MLLLAVFGAILAIGLMMFIDPAMKRATSAERASVEQRRQLDDLKAQLLALQSPGQDPDVAVRLELDGLKQKLGELGTRFSAMESALVPPERMPALLEALIGRNSGLRLVSLRTLPVTPVLDKGTAKAADGSASVEVLPAAGLYKHGVEIRLEGGIRIWRPIWRVLNSRRRNCCGAVHHCQQTSIQS